MIASNSPHKNIQLLIHESRNSFDRNITSRRAYIHLINSRFLSDQTTLYDQCMHATYVVLRKLTKSTFLFKLIFFPNRNSYSNSKQNSIKKNCFYNFLHFDISDLQFKFQSKLIYNKTHNQLSCGEHIPNNENGVADSYSTYFLFSHLFLALALVSMLDKLCVRHIYVK